MRAAMQTLTCGTRKLIVGERTLVMGVINVTPDSFSDGGKYYDAQCGIEHGIKLIEEGADIIDVGGVATSPHLAADQTVSADEECSRVIPVIKGLVAQGIYNISIDTLRASVASAALDAGASWVNDQSAGLNDREMAKVMARAEGVVLMHNSGGHSGVDAGEKLVFDDVMAMLLEFFLCRIKDLGEQGVSAEKIIVDPGVGFGKGLIDSLTIINNMHRLRELNAVTLIGLSRKSFLYKLTGIEKPSDRDFATLGANAAAMMSGAHIIRTHNVRATVDMARVLDRCLFEKQRGEKPHENLYQTR